MPEKAPSGYFIVRFAISSQTFSPLDRFLLQGLPSETRWLLGQRPVGGARPELVRYQLFLGPWDVRLS